MLVQKDISETFINLQPVKVWFSSPLGPCSSNMAVENLPFVDLVSIRMSMWFADFPVEVHNPSSAKPKGRRSACSRTKDMAAGAMLCVCFPSLTFCKRGWSCRYSNQPYPFGLQMMIDSVRILCCAVLDDLHAVLGPFYKPPSHGIMGFMKPKGSAIGLRYMTFKADLFQEQIKKSTEMMRFLFCETPHLSTALSSFILPSPPPRLSTAVILSPCRGPHVSSAEVSLLDHVEDSTRSA